MAEIKSALWVGEMGVGTTLPTPTRDTILIWRKCGEVHSDLSDKIGPILVGDCRRGGEGGWHSEEEEVDEGEGAETEGRECHEEGGVSRMHERGLGEEGRCV